MESVKRIVFSVVNDLNYDQRMKRICSTLQENGFQCLLVGRLLPNSIDLTLENFEQKRLKCWFISGKLFYIEYNIRLFFFLFKTKADAVCSIDLDTVMPGLAVAKLKKWKHIFDAHELFTDVPEVVDRPMVQKVWKWVQKRAFAKTDLAYTVGPAIAKHFESLYGRKTEVVRNVPYLKKALPYNPSQEKFILYQGALNKGRGLEVLLQAMQQIPCTLVLAGEGDLSHSLRQLAADLKISDRVIFKGFIKPEELKVLTSQAWIGMNVSENAGMSYYLSLNNKCFDYIHAGLPSLINPFPEYLTINDMYNVGVITHPTVSDIVAHANELLTNEALHENLHRNCIAASQKLNWETESQILIKLYTTLFEK